MTLLSSQYIYVGSHYGDAQLLRVLPDRSSHSGTFLEIVENYKNIAPITDAILGDFDGSGQVIYWL